MYDAVNRGFKRARGEILAYLNCDEQYLPGALAAVDRYFNEHPEIDVVFADAVVVKSDGEYICHRYALRPVLAYTWLRFSVLTCSMFLRRKVIDEQQLFFDTQWRDLGDIYWVEEVLKRGIPNGILRHMTSVFTDTGENMNLSANATREKAI
jgi:glycosyltransferase involved in cell wall biosynthesis